ncbi:hypothetical protein, partial [Lactobacillus crispatus]|uniref:hypothetical protein n=1 Tax=Lactobacillus crispatus TaxID=47770 RepID=UPI00197C75E4
QSYGKRIPFSNIQGNKIKEIFILTQNILQSPILPMLIIILFYKFDGLEKVLCFNSYRPLSGLIN